MILLVLLTADVLVVCLTKVRRHHARADSGAFDVFRSSVPTTVNGPDSQPLHHDAVSRGDLDAELPRLCAAGRRLVEDERPLSPITQCGIGVRPIEATSAL